MHPRTHHHGREFVPGAPRDVDSARLPSRPSKSRARRFPRHQRVSRAPQGLPLLPPSIDNFTVHLDSVVPDIVKPLASAASPIVTDVVNAGDSVLSFAKSAASGVAAPVETGASAVVSDATSLLEPIASAVVSDTTSLVEPIISPLVSDVTAPAEPIVSGVASAVDSALPAALTPVASIVSKPLSPLASGVDSAVGAVSSVLGPISSVAASILDGATSDLSPPLPSPTPSPETSGELPASSSFSASGSQSALSSSVTPTNSATSVVTSGSSSSIAPSSSSSHSLTSVSRSSALPTGLPSSTALPSSLLSAFASTGPSSSPSSTVSVGITSSPSSTPGSGFFQNSAVVAGTFSAVGVFVLAFVVGAGVFMRRHGGGRHAVPMVDPDEGTAIMRENHYHDGSFNNGGDDVLYPAPTHSSLNGGHGALRSPSTDSFLEMGADPAAVGSEASWIMRSPKAPKADLPSSVMSTERFKRPPSLLSPPPSSAPPRPPLSPMAPHSVRWSNLPPEVDPSWDSEPGLLPSGTFATEPVWRGDVRPDSPTSSRLTRTPSPLYDPFSDVPAAATTVDPYRDMAHSPDRRLSISQLSPSLASDPATMPATSLIAAGRESMLLYNGQDHDDRASWMERVGYGTRPVTLASTATIDHISPR